MDITYRSNEAVSEISQQTDEEKFMQKWDKILKSGMGNPTDFFNPYA